MVSPVKLVLTPSLFAVRTSDLELLADMVGVPPGVVGVEGVIEAVECFRKAIENTDQPVFMGRRRALCMRQD